MRNKAGRIIYLVISLMVLAVVYAPGPTIPAETATPALAQARLPQEDLQAGQFSFAVAADMRYFSGPGEYNSPAYFLGATQALANTGEFAFLVSPGDIDPVINVRWTITSTFGTALPWVPVVGNHELPGGGVENTPGDNMAWLRAWPAGGGAFVANPGPAACPTTTYSFDYQTAHFVILNEYCDEAGDSVTMGNIPDLLYNWLVADLANTTQPYIFVIGHEPAFPQPDMQNGRLRHEYDSLNQYLIERDRFWQLLRNEGVLAYICGHTHNFSAAQIEGLWQVDAGHARGLGDPGAPSTVLLFTIQSEMVKLVAYRETQSGGVYAPKYTFYLSGGKHVYLPLVSMDDLMK